MHNGRISNEVLRQLCIKNRWFTQGTTRQYEKLFDMNDQLASIEQIATVIWLCSDWDVTCRRDIIFELDKAGFTASTRNPSASTYKTGSTSDL